MESLGGYHFLYFKIVPLFISDAELEDNILKYNLIPSNVPPPSPLDEFLRGVLENHKYSHMQEDKIFQKMQQKGYLLKNKTT